MGNRIGRPPSARQISYRLRLSDYELHILREAAKANFQEISSFARDSILTAACDTLEAVERARRTSPETGGTEALVGRRVGASGSAPRPRDRAPLRANDGG